VCAEQRIVVNEGGGDRDRRGQLAPTPIDNIRKRRNVTQQGCGFAYKFYLFGQTTDLQTQKFSASSHITPHTPSSSATHVPDILNVDPIETDSDRGYASSVDVEDDWFGPLEDVQPGAPVARKVSKATNVEVRVYH